MINTKKGGSKIMVKYKLTEKLNEQVIEEILNIQKEKGLTPENIVKAAKDKDNALHKLFEWDNTLAGSNWRLQQARVIVNDIKIVIGERDEISAFENVSISIVSVDKDSDNEVSKQYVPITEILNSKDLREQVIRSALNNLDYWTKQYSLYEELSPIIKSIKAVKEKLDKK